MMRAILLLVAVFTTCIASAASPPPPVPPILRDDAPPVQLFALRNVQAGFMWYTWSNAFGPAERWLVTGEVVASNVPGGGCTVRVILDGNATGFVAYEASEVLDMTAYDHWDFGCWVDIPAGYFVIATVIAENCWLEKAREYVQLPPSLAEAPHPAWTD